MVSEHGVIAVFESAAPTDSIALVRGVCSIASSPAHARQGRRSLPRCHRPVCRGSLFGRGGDGRPGMPFLSRSAGGRGCAQRFRRLGSCRFGGRPATLPCALRRESRRLPRATWPVLAAVHRPGYDPAGFLRVGASGSGGPTSRLARGWPAGGAVSANADCAWQGPSLGPRPSLGQQPRPAAWPVVASGRRFRHDALCLFAARISGCRGANASLLLPGDRGGIVSDALMVVDRGALGPSRSNMAVGGNGQRLWNYVRTGCEDSQRSCVRASRRYRLHAPRPRRASLLQGHRNVQQSKASCRAKPRHKPELNYFRDREAT